jgi:hypothetical protein
LARLEDLASAHYGETIWVLGSGPSLNFLTPQFFEDKTTVSTNLSAHTLGFQPDYVFSHYHRWAREMPARMEKVTLKRDTLSLEEWAGAVPDDVVLIEQDNYNPPGSAWNPLTTHPPKPHSLAYGSSSLHGSMHLAAWLGAAHIVLVGADCGTIDGEHRVEGYPDNDKLWVLYNEHHALMKEWLVREYGVTVYSLNPFVNLNLEGHKFEGV